MAEKEEILTLQQIKDQLGKEKDKKEFLKKFIAKKEYVDIKTELVKIAYPEIIKDEAKTQYTLTYDSFSDGLEPIYFWLLDFMRDRAPGGLNLKVFKGIEQYEASVASGYFSEMGGKKTQMQQKASDYLGAINQVMKSIINLIYDLKEFELRLQHYDRFKSKDEKEKEKGRMALKFVWMDQVDIKNGAGSINALAQNLNFPTLRPAFLQYKGDSVGELEKAAETLNKNVLSIVKKKFIDFYDWVKYSEEEIRNRYNVEKAYLRSQVGTLQLYAKWAKPYLVAAEKLNMKEFNTPDIVNSFSNMQMELEIFGKKEIKPADINKNFEKIKTDRKFYAVVRIKLRFRTIPQTVQSQGGRQYVHGGRTDLVFQAYAVDDIELDVIESQERYEDMDLVEKWIDVSLKSLQKELDKYLDQKEEKKEEKPKEKAKFENPFKGTFDGVIEVVGPLKELFKPVPKEPFLKKETMKAAEEAANKNCELIYTVYKKTHGMLAPE